MGALRWCKNDTHTGRKTNCCLLLLLPGETEINHSQGNPSVVHFPTAKAVATLARSSSAGRSEDGSIRICPAPSSG